MFIREHLLHRAGEASENLALTRNRDPFESNQAKVGMPADKRKGLLITVEVYGRSRTVNGLSSSQSDRTMRKAPDVWT
jgi:hypothetical protein